MKSSFTVIIDGVHLPKMIVITGVTSIFPNLNGFLFNTEDRVGYQLEAHNLIDGGITGISFEYSYYDNEDIEHFKTQYHKYEVHDHKLK